jgi:DME family drug/metabolite transporter
MTGPGPASPDGPVSPGGARSPSGGTLAVVLAALLWGTTGTATHFVPGVSAAVIGAVTFGLGGLVMAGLAARRTLAVLRTRSGLPFVLVAAGSLAVYAIVFYAALALAGVALGTTVAIGTSPAFAGLVDLVSRGTRVTRRWVVANVVSVAGMAMITLARASASEHGAWVLLAGVLCGLAAGLTYALYTWAVAEVVSGRGVEGSRGARGAQGVRGVVGAVFGVAAVPLAVVALVAGREDLVEPGNWPVFLYLALVPTVLGHTLYAIGLRSVTAAAATLLSLLEPVVAAVLAVVVVGEHLGVVGWIGVGGVVVGLGILGVPARVDDQWILRVFRR